MCAWQLGLFFAPTHAFATQMLSAKLNDAPYAKLSLAKGVERSAEFESV
jgi:hypothetical protein